MTTRHFFAFFLRGGLTITALVLTFSTIPLADIWPLLKQANSGWSLVAVLTLQIAQYISAQRTRFYLTHHGVTMPPLASLQLHYIGGLFNAFLPGSTGGDAYKAWWLKKQTDSSLMSMISLMIANRLNGLWPLGVLTCFMMMVSEPIRHFLPWPVLLLASLMILGSLSYHAVARFFLSESLSHQYRAGFFYSLPIQLLSLLSAWALLKALSLTGSPMDYLILFMVSCVVAMLPLSIGGIGLREYTLLHGAPLLGVSAQGGVALAFASTLLSLTVPLIGAIVYAFSTPRMDLQQPELSQ